MANFLPGEIVDQALRCFIDEKMSTREVAERCRISKVTANTIQKMLTQNQVDPTGRWVAEKGKRLKFIPHPTSNQKTT